MLNRVYNFSAGPSTLPLSVMEKIKEDFLDYKGTGASIIEISHRHKIFGDILYSANPVGCFADSASLTDLKFRLITLDCL